jgi:hypothetical protein
MCKRLIFLISFALLLAPMSTVCADTYDEVTGETAVSGTVSGTYGATTHCNDVYESITEVSNGSYSYLEHKWTIDVDGGTAVINIYVEAYHSSNSEGDDFVFAYSTDDVNYTDMFTVTKTADDDKYQQYDLPNTVSGTLYVRVRDADRSGGNTSLDTVYVDNIFVRNHSAGTCSWSGYTGDSLLWDDCTAWSGAIPEGVDTVTISERDYENRCVIDSTVTAECNELKLADNVWGIGQCYLEMTGGTLTVDSNNFEIGCKIVDAWYNVRDTGIFNISGGNVYVKNKMYVGMNAYGTINMTGGTIDVNQGLYIPQATSGTGTVNLHYGSLYAGSIGMDTNGLVDIEKGELVIDGNVISTINGYVTSGRITAYDGNGTVSVNYNTSHAGKTTAYATIGKSWNPSPAAGAEDVNRLITLSWSVGVWVDTHQIYLGTSFSDVNSATTSSSVYKGSQNKDSNSYNPGGLNLERTYYWRVDEINPNEPWGSPWKGNVWSFTVSDYVVLEDFESYTDDSDLVATWIDGTDGNNPSSSTVFLGTDFFERHDGNTMVFDFDNSSSPYYSEIWRSYTTAQDWTVGGAKKLVLFFHGTEDSNITEQMYVVLEDADSNAVVTYDGDANDLVQQDGEYWHVWNIDLQDFNDANKVNEKAIEKIIIGFGDRDNPSAGNTGTVYFDDIRLYVHSCPGDGTEYMADADFDSDERVSIEDFRKFAIAWMSSDGEPNFGDIYDLDSNDAVTTCDLGLFSDDWLWPTSEVTITVNAGSVDGNISPYLNGASLAYCYSTDDIYADGTIADYLKEAGVKALRYPGGGKSSFYHWEYPYMTIHTDAWSPDIDLDAYTQNTQYMDTDELVALANTIGAEPVITVNFKSGLRYRTLEDSVNDAVNWVTYCNVTNDYNIIYWSIENEPYYGNNGGEVNVYDYADYVNQFSTAMKAVDANIKIIANWNNELSEPNYWQKWEYLFENAGDNFDYGDVHWYWFWSNGTWNIWKEQNPMKVREWCPDCYDDYDPGNYLYQGPSYIDETQRFNNEANGIKLLALEWNVAPVVNREYSKFQQALMQSEMLGQFIAGGLYMATIWPLEFKVYLDWNFRTLLDQENHEPTPTFLVFKLYKEALGHKLITSSSGNDHIFVVSALSQDGNTLWSYLVNKTANPITAQLDISSFTTAGAEAVAMIANDNDVESNGANLRELEINYNSGTTKWESVLPPFSLTRLTLHQ